MNPPYKVPVTRRMAHELVVAHGFADVETFAGSLPESAAVLDVGAGASTFGTDITYFRPDITWHNVDPWYADPGITQGLAGENPPNLQLVPGTAEMVTNLYPPETFDAVCSYWVLPHFVKTPEYVEECARQMYTVTKFGGFVSIGPHIQVDDHGRGAIRTIKRSADPAAFAARVVRNIHIPFSLRD
jgi:hypothetical protein